MSSVSGFDPLFVALRESCDGGVIDHFVPKSDQSGLFDFIRKKIFNRILPPQRISETPTSPFVLPRHEKAAMAVRRSAQKHPSARVLLSAGENQFGLNFSKAPESIRRRLVVTLHQPPSWLRLHWRDFRDLNGLGGIICLSTEQRDFIAGTCTTPTILLRHGVRHDFFMPGVHKPSDDPPRLLFVGQWLRDFDTLAGAMEHIWRMRPEVRLNCVIIHQSRNHPSLLKLARDPRVEWHADITPENLRNLYQQSTLLFLPMIDAVGNNAIVEALASGLPIVSTMVGGLPDYVPSGAGQLCRAHDVKEHAEAVLRWLPDQDRRGQARIIGREFAEQELDWGGLSRRLVQNLKGASL